MVLEVAHVEVLDGHKEAFEADLLTAASTVLPKADGFLEFTGHGWGVERPSVYLFTIRWESVEQHMDFRASEAFGEWRGLIGGHFASAPVVEHYG